MADLLTRLFVELGSWVSCGDLLVRGTLRANTIAQVTAGFLYVITGIEPNGGVDFVIPFPTTRPNTNYVATVVCAGVSGFVLVDVPSANYATTGVRVKLSAQLAPGDVLAVQVQER